MNEFKWPNEPLFSKEKVEELRTYQIRTLRDWCNEIIRERNINININTKPNCIAVTCPYDIQGLIDRVTALERNSIQGPGVESLNQEHDKLVNELIEFKNERYDLDMKWERRFSQLSRHLYNIHTELIDLTGTVEHIITNDDNHEIEKEEK